LYEPERSLIEQSRRHGPDMSVPNADGHGFGWYGRREVPALFRSADPAWGEENLSEVAGEVESGLFLAHVRAATGTPIQRTNCHPFRFGRWLFVHNGYIANLESVRRDLLFAVRPDLFSNILGSTDSELMFHLALTFGLEEDPIGGLERMAGFVESCGQQRGIDEPLQMTVGLTDGERLYAARYASGPIVNSLSSPRMLPQCGCFTPTTSGSLTSPTTRGLSSPSRWSTCLGYGGRSRPGPRWWLDPPSRNGPSNRGHRSRYRSRWVGTVDDDVLADPGRVWSGTLSFGAEWKEPQQ
jgi:predicted glutamine amidotransferase